LAEEILIVEHLCNLGALPQTDFASSPSPFASSPALRFPSVHLQRSAPGDDSQLSRLARGLRPGEGPGVSGALTDEDRGVECQSSDLASALERRRIVVGKLAPPPLRPGIAIAPGCSTD
jgi:hypothetical protein